MLNSILTETVSSGITLPQLVICTLTSLGLGLALAFLHTYRNTSSRNFVMTLAILPAVVQAVIMLVNGNPGTGGAGKSHCQGIKGRMLYFLHHVLSSVLSAAGSGLG